MKCDLWRVCVWIAIPLTFIAQNLAQWQASELDRLEITDGTLLQDFGYLSKPIKRMVKANDESRTFAMVQESSIGNP